jgi:hypothetical protein
MARNRMIKPEFWDDEKLSKISRDARLTYIGLWNFSDDYGVVKGNPSWLKNHIFPYEDSMSIQKFTAILTELSSGLWILPFGYNGETYFYIKNFLNHQTINRPSKQRNPLPPDGLMEGSLSDAVPIMDEIKDKLSINENKRKIKTNPPECISLKVWQDFIDHRSSLKKPMTEKAKSLMISRLMEMHEKGHDVNDILENSIINGWQGIFEPKDKNNGTNKPFNKTKNGKNAKKSDYSEYDEGAETFQV